MPAGGHKNISLRFGESNYCPASQEEKLRPASTRASKLYSRRSCSAISRRRKEKPIVSLDPRGRSMRPWPTSLSSARRNSSVQIKAIADAIEQKVKEDCERALHTTPSAAILWTLVDYVNIVVHIFNRRRTVNSMILKVCGWMRYAWSTMIKP